MWVRSVVSVCVCVSVSGGMRWTAHSGRAAPPGVWLLPSSGANHLSDDHHDSCRAPQETRRCEPSQLLLWKSPEAFDEDERRCFSVWSGSTAVYSLYDHVKCPTASVHLKYCWALIISAATRWSCESTEPQCGEAVGLWDDEL